MKRCPDLFPDVLLAWNLFHELSLARQIGWQANPILYTEILALLDIYQIQIAMRIELTELIRHMDIVWLEYVAEKSNA